MELIFVFLFLIIIYSIAFALKGRVPLPYRKYFITALTLKIIGAILLGLIYKYYYGYGDTLRYHFHSRIISRTFWEDPILALRLLTINLNNPDPNLVVYFTHNYFFGVKDPGSFLIVRLTGFLGIFNGHSYYTIAIIFAFLSFTGIWKLYRTFCYLYPALYKQFALAFLFIPSVFFWGSGLMKDTIAIGALGWLTYALFNLFIKKEKLIINIIILFISAYLIAIIKIYILLCFLPGAILWISAAQVEKRRSLKTILKPALIILSIPISLFFLDKVGEIDKRYALENLESTAEITAEWIHYSSGESGSAYSLGNDFDLSPTGILKKLPLAINVTLFRPYLWEVKNPVMLLSSIESTLFLLFTTYLIFKIGLFSLIKQINKNPLTLFLFIFTFAFAFAVGISTYNFGSLARYKIPCIPFFVAMLFIAQHDGLNTKGGKKTI